MPKPARRAKAATAAEALLFEWEMVDWLTSRGAVVPPKKLQPQQEAQIEECFQMLDTSQSGALNAGALFAAFKQMGYQVSQQAIDGMVECVDADNSGVIEFDEFRSLMAATLRQDVEAASGAQEEAAPGMPDASVPFSGLAMALRRCKLIAELLEAQDGQKEQASQG